MLPFFGSCIIHILYTGVLKFKKKIPAPKGASVLAGGGLSTSAPTDLPHGKEPWNPTNRRLGGSQSQYGCLRGDMSLALIGIRSWIIQPAG